MDRSERNPLIMAAIESNTWLVTEGALDQIRAIAAGFGDPEAVSKFAGVNREMQISLIHDGIGVLNCTGPIIRYADMFSDVSGLTSIERVSAAYAELDEDPRVKQIVIQFNTPGGMANGISEVGALIAAGKTPTVGYATGDCCSAGYWLASQCDTIYVNNTAIVGCIGVRARAPGEPGNNEIVSQYAPAKLGSRAAAQNVVDRLEEEFLLAVATGRGVTVEHVVEHFGQGGVFVGADAVSAGLADGVATLDQILAGTVGMPPVRRRAITSSDTGDTMTDKSTGGIPTADHEAAVRTARDEGYAAGKLEAEQAAATVQETAVAAAVTAETARVCGIFEAGAAKPVSSLISLVKLPGATAENTKATIDGLAEIGIESPSLSSLMNGTNPEVTNNTPDNDEDGDASADWADIREGAA